MPAPKHQRHCRLSHPRNHFRYGKPCLNVAAHRIEQKKQAIHIVALLDSCKQGQDMLVFRGLHRLRGHLVALNLAYNGQRVNIALFRTGHVGTQLHNLVPLLFLDIRVFLRFHVRPPFYIGYPKSGDSIPYCKKEKRRL